MADLRIPGHICTSTKPCDSRQGGNLPRANVAIPGCKDAWHLREFTRRAKFVAEAWALCSRRFGEKAVHRHVGKGFYSVVKTIFPSLFPALGVFVATTITAALVGLSIGAMVGGLGAAPATIIGAKVGMMLGMWILSWMGVAFLLPFITDRVGELGVLCKSGVLRAWNSGGSDKEIELAARDFAELLGLFHALLLQSLIQFMVKAAEDGRVAESMGLLRNSRLLRTCEKLEQWLLKNYPRMRERYVPFAWTTLSQAPTIGHRRPDWVRIKVANRQFVIDFASEGDGSKESIELSKGPVSSQTQDEFPWNGLAGLLDHVEGKLVFQPRQVYYLSGSELAGWRLAVDTRQSIWKVSQLVIPQGFRRGGRWVSHVEDAKKAADRL